MTKYVKIPENEKPTGVINHSSCSTTIYRLRQELNATRQENQKLKDKIFKKDVKRQAFAAIRSAKKRTTTPIPTQIDTLNHYMSKRSKNELIILSNFFLKMEGIFLDANSINLRMLIDWNRYELGTRI